MATEKYKKQVQIEVCLRKIKHTFVGAKITLKKIEKVRGKTTLNVYHCKICDGYHLGHNNGKI